MAKTRGSSVKKRNKKTTKTRSGGNVFIAISVAIALVAAIGVFMILSQVTSTSTYYVLNQQIDARSEITADMLTEVKTSTNGQPRNALDISTFTTDEPIYARYQLDEGDIVSPSSVGLYSPIQEGVPEDHVVASFAVPAENAAAGKIKRGDYVDVIAVGEDASEENSFAQYVLRHALILDTAADLGAEQQSDEEVDAAEDSGVRSGIPTIYTVSLPPADAAKLAITDGLPITVVLSPIEYETEGVPSDPTYVNPGDVFGPEAFIGDSGKGTDPTFGQETEEEEGDDSSGEEGSQGGSDGEESEEPTGDDADESDSSDGEANENDDESVDNENEGDSSNDG